MSAAMETEADENSPPVGIFTLIIPVDYENQKVFLSKKARGKGKGKWIGFGGKLEPGESADEGAARELKEESNLSIAVEQLRKVGLIMYNYSDAARSPRGAMHVYTLDKKLFHEADLKTNDEFLPNSGQWFDRHNIPLDNMWADFSLWSTKFFEGKRFRALINYKDQQLNIAGLEFISEVTNPNDDLLPPGDWLQICA